MPNAPASPSSSSDEPEQDASQDRNAEPIPSKIRRRYLSHISEHMTNLRHHLAGTERDHSSSPSLFAPNTCWTSHEKDAFFHALGIHSRFRPDLIAEEVKTKNIAEVTAYIQMLDDALEDCRAGHAVDGTRFTAIPRAELSTAHEVTEKWVRYEGRLADAVISEEANIAAKAIQKDRDKEMHAHSLALRAKKGAAKGEDGRRDRQAEKAKKLEFREWQARKKAEWDVRDFLDAMDGITLRAMDTLLREYEESTSLDDASVRDSRESSMVAGQEHDSPTIQVAAAQQGTDGRPDNVPSATTPIPTSITLSSGTNGTREPSLPSSSARSDAEPPLSPQARRRLLKRLHMRKKRAAASGAVVDLAPQRLKPGRKSKSSLNSSPSGSDHPSDVPQTTVQGQDVGQDQKIAKEARPSHVSGKTMPYKVREQLGGMGIDVQWLQHEGLDFFHLGNISKLMSAYNSMSDADPAVVSQVSADFLRLLFAHVVNFTTGVVRKAIVSREQEYLAKSRTKAWRVANQKTLTAGNVSHALALLGVEITDKRAHFQRLLDELEPEAEEDEDQRSEKEDEEDEADEEEGEEEEHELESHAGSEDTESGRESTFADLLSTVPMHRLVNPPLVVLPSSALPSSSRSSLVAPLLTYIPWTGGITSTSAGDDDSSGSDDDDADAAMSADDSDEEVLDERDQRADAAHEKSLWESLGPAVGVRLGKRKRGDDDSDSDSEDSDSSVGEEAMRHVEGRDVRFRAPGGRIKSAVYVEDSD